MFSATQEQPSPPPNKKVKVMMKKFQNLVVVLCFVQAEKSENSENTFNIESINKSENSAKSSIVIKPRHLKYPVLINMEKKLDMILSKISKLNCKLPDEVKPHSQANERPKSYRHSNKLTNQ